MDAENFLASKGIDPKNTTLICYIGGAMRQPLLINLMEEYAYLKVLQSNKFNESLQNQIKDESSTKDNQRP